MGSRFLCLSIAIRRLSLRWGERGPGQAEIDVAAEAKGRLRARRELVESVDRSIERTFGPFFPA
ncbi:MAG: hypothetical protein HYY16_10345 [Planctomycetes bacterium]|nr:hypothetical protein [Planctomycetota bacterium]